MPNTEPHPSPTPPACALRPLPTTIWLPASGDTTRIPAAPAVLPGWALARIRSEFTHRSGHHPGDLIRIAISDTEPGMDARTPAITHSAPGPDSGMEANRQPSIPPTLLAELHPNALPAQPPLTASAGDFPGAMEEGWPGFFHRAHRLLPTDGLLLLATRQRREAGRLTDPLGTLIACARTAGFRYLQHIVIVHGHAGSDRIIPPADTTGASTVAHSDLLALTAIHTR